MRYAPNRTLAAAACAVALASSTSVLAQIHTDATTRPANELFVITSLNATQPTTTQASTSPSTTQSTTAPTTIQASTQASTAPSSTQPAQDAVTAAQQAAQAAQTAAQAAQQASQAAAQAAAHAAAAAAAQAAQAASQAAQAAQQAAQAAQAAAQALQATTQQPTTTQVVVTQPSTTQVVVASTTSTSPSTTQSTTTQSTTTQSTTTQSTTTQASTQPGRFFGGLLDHRSLYGQNWFPQPLASFSADAGSQLFVNTIHQQGNQQSTAVTAGVEQRFEMATLTLEANYVRQNQSPPPPGSADETMNGISTFDIALRQPLYQYVSKDGKFDSTFGVRGLIGIPSGSDVGQDGRAELDLWDLIRLGDFWAVQLSVGANEYFGPDHGGETTVPWSVSVGRRLERDQLNLPGISETWLMAELDGDGQLSGSSAGNPIFGVVGAWFDFKPVSHYQPRLGVGAFVPLEGKAENQADWGVIVNFLLLF